HGDVLDERPVLGPDADPVGAVELAVVEVVAQGAPALLEHLLVFLVAADGHLDPERDDGRGIERRAFGYVQAALPTKPASRAAGRIRAGADPAKGPARPGHANLTRAVSEIDQFDRPPRPLNLRRH